MHIHNLCVTDTTDYPHKRKKELWQIPPIDTCNPHVWKAGVKTALSTVSAAGTPSHALCDTPPKI